MGHSKFDDASRERAAWNAGKKVGTKRPFTQKQIWAIRFFLDRERRIRDRALFDPAIDSKLRGCDLVKIRIRDVVAGPEIRTRAIVVQQKTGRPVQFEITSDVRASLLAWRDRPVCSLTYPILLTGGVPAVPAIWGCVGQERLRPAGRAHSRSPFTAINRSACDGILSRATRDARSILPSTGRSPFRQSCRWPHWCSSKRRWA